MVVAVVDTVAVSFVAVEIVVVGGGVVEVLGSCFLFVSTIEKNMIIIIIIKINSDEHTRQDKLTHNRWAW